MTNYSHQVINGRLVETDKAAIPLNDLGLLRSYAVFDYLRVIRGVPVFLEEHVSRLIRSANTMDMKLGWSVDEITGMCRDLVAVTGVENSGLRMIVTGGYSEDGFTPAEPNLYIMLGKLPVYPKTLYTDGAKLITAEYLRDEPEVKTTIYVQSIRERQRMAENDAVEVLYHWNGKIGECSRSNFFIVDSDNTVITPSAGMLLGVTRKHVIDLASKNYEVSGREVSLNEVFTAREAFITSSNKGVMPVVAIDGKTIGDGKVGDVTSHLMKELAAAIDEYIAEAKLATKTQ